MTISPWIIYLWATADNIHAAFTAFAVLSSIFTIVLWIIIGVNAAPPVTITDAQLSYWVPWNRRVSIIAGILLAFATLFPSSKTIALIVVIPAIINSEPIQKDLPEIYQMAKDALKQTLITK